MADEAIGQRFDEARTIAGSGAFDGVAGSATHSRYVVAVDRLRRNLHRLRPSDDLARGDVAKRRVLAVAVVLANEDHRQPQHSREIHALEEVDLGGGPVAEEGDSDLPSAAKRKACPGSSPDAAA